MIHPRSGPTFAHRTIGLLGGSFNPAHAGHRDMSLHAIKRLGLYQVWWLVSPQNPLKSSLGMAPIKQRIGHARETANHPKIIVTNIEQHLGTRYTIDTLRALKRRFPHTRFVWLMGADNLSQMPLWRDWADIFRLVPVAVFRRPAYAAGCGRGKAAQRFVHGWNPSSQGKLLARKKLPAWVVVDNRLNDLSATDIRKDEHTWQS
jgi:nicotinate-nucleotide adenylyltransferase